MDAEEAVAAKTGVQAFAWSGLRSKDDYVKLNLQLELFDPRLRAQIKSKMWSWSMLRAVVYIKSPDPFAAWHIERNSFDRSPLHRAWL